MFNKRGLNQVVTTVLIILLVLIAVLIIWNAVRPTIQSVEDQSVVECINIDLDLERCSLDTESGEASVTVKRNLGDGDLQGIKFAFTNETSAEIIDDDSGQGEIPGEFETKTFSFDSIDLEGDVEVDVIPLVGEQKSSCSPTNNPVSC